MAIFQQPFMTGGFPSMNRAAGAVGGWVELGRTTLGAAADTISVSSLSDKRYYMILLDKPTSGDSSFRCRLNSDSGSNYARRYSTNGASDTTATSQNAMYFSANQSHDEFSVGYIANLSANEKLALGHTVAEGGAGAANDPERSEWTGKWANTSNAVDEITAVNLGSGDYASGSELVVLGWDPADTHTNNFWEELASVDLSGGAANTLDTGTFTAKKYLWIQAYITANGANINPDFEFNGDTGSNYARRISSNGAADGTSTSTSAVLFRIAEDQNPSFINMFIINNASNEKLGILHNIEGGGSGAANDPDRTENVIKWANTSNQITQIELQQGATPSTNTFGTDTIIKVWGAN